jgi:DNA-binding transcriptional regulator YhcF (GntR family)|tara:strand:+ start:174 stop:773 length:600 start_codon:yes stop_codon:yes gene_type:complete
MSFDAMNWASKQDCQNSTNKLILLMLANYSDENDSSFPSYRHLASLCSCTERTAMRAIDSLIQMGLIKKEERYMKDGKQTSNRFILNRGDKIDTQGMTKSTPNTIRDIQRDYTEEFNQWWNLYPRRDGSKRKAFEIYKKIIDKEISITDLYNVTNRFKQLMKGKEEKFIPHATTWLNQRRFETVEENKNIKINLNQIAG